MAAFDLATLLSQRDLISARVLADAQKEAASRRADLETVVIERKLVDSLALAQLKSEVLQLPLKVFGEDEIVPRETLLLIPLQSAKHYAMVAFHKDAKNLYVGMVRPENPDAQSALQFIAQGLGLDVQISVIAKPDFERLVKRYGSMGEDMAKMLASIKQQTSSSTFKTNILVSLEESKDVTMEDTPIIKMVSEMIKNAVNTRASDIHIEPERNRLRVRYRVDGDLASVLFLPIEIHPAVIARIKIMSNLKIDETRVPQDGRFGAILDGRQIDFRVSSFPTASGEKIAIRILDPSTGLRSLESLGLSPWNLGIIHDAVKKPFGMILVTGPTGSGKTTTLYAMLQILSQDNVNVVTLEDPIEYFISGVNQSQVIPEIGYTFASGLRSILRQDPDIIMVGEIRDNETAELAVHSALTGHIVLSTLHTNNAVGSIPRLLDLGVQRFLLPSTINIIASQRLVRVLCPDCKRRVEPTPEQEKVIDDNLATLPEAFKQSLHIAKPYVLYEPVGCDACKGRGFLGRIGIHEVLKMTPDLERIILTGIGEAQLLEEAKRQGMITIRQEGMLHLLEGIIPFAEVIRESY
jgi:type IV pilus assembly protein PilB